MRRLLLSLILLVLGAGIVRAQTGGQFCVRAFEDRNGNGQMDSGEPFLTRGVSVNLLNAQNVTVASGLLDNSPTAAQGVLCFQFLEAGQYSLEITSPDFNATTPSTVTASISEGSIPTLVQYGGQRITDAPIITDETTATDEEMLPRLVLSGLGALLVLAGMAVLGMIIYLMAFRQRVPARPYYAASPPTPTPSDMPPVVLGEDDIPDMPEGLDPLADEEEGVSESHPLIQEDTDQIKPV